MQGLVVHIDYGGDSSSKLRISCSFQVFESSMSSHIDIGNCWVQPILSPIDKVSDSSGTESCQRLPKKSNASQREQTDELIA